jgi:hypothetical protein
MLHPCVLRISSWKCSLLSMRSCERFKAISSGVRNSGTHVQSRGEGLRRVHSVANLEPQSTREYWSENPNQNLSSAAVCCRLLVTHTATLFCLSNLVVRGKRKTESIKHQPMTWSQEVHCRGRNTVCERFSHRLSKLSRVANSLSLGSW